MRSDDGTDNDSIFYLASGAAIGIDTSGLDEMSPEDRSVELKKRQEQAVDTAGRYHTDAAVFARLTKQTKCVKF